jgi:hypothetical protein
MPSASLVSSTLRAGDGGLPTRALGLEGRASFRGPLSDGTGCLGTGSGEDGSCVGSDEFLSRMVGTVAEVCSFEGGDVGLQVGRVVLGGLLVASGSAESLAVSF